MWQTDPLASSLSVVLSCHRSIIRINIAAASVLWALSVRRWQTHLLRALDFIAVEQTGGLKTEENGGRRVSERPLITRQPAQSHGQRLSWGLASQPPGAKDYQRLENDTWYHPESKSSPNDTLVSWPGDTLLLHPETVDKLLSFRPPERPAYLISQPGESEEKISYTSGNEGRSFLGVCRQNEAINWFISTWQSSFLTRHLKESNLLNSSASFSVSLMGL